jgi:cytochrome P450
MQTVSAIDTFVLAMMLHPESQRKAQRQIDEVLKGRRLPDIKDRESLAYVDAILMEVLRYVTCFSLILRLLLITFRWNPVAPLGEGASPQDGDI